MQSKSQEQRKETKTGKICRQGADALALKQIKIKGGFWGRLMERNRRITLPSEYKQCKATGHIEALKLTWKKGDPNPPHIFWDSDLGKWIEAAAYSLAAHPEPVLERRVDGVIELIARAQQPDGYLNIHFTVVEPEKRWTNLRDWHELYCAGHLIEAAVAYYEATGKRKFLEVMGRYADHIARIFGPRRGQKRGYCGHPEVELALVKLYRATNKKRYLDLARFFIDERGQRPHYFDREARARGEDPRRFWFSKYNGDPRRFCSYEYTQAHLPVRKQREVVGHAVRAMYLYCGMADTAVITGDQVLIEACKKLWANLVGAQMHITGGVGPAPLHEAFTQAFDLPNEGAYLETCAAIGLVFWAWRMLQAEWDGAYADVMERALYNGTISGVSADGRTFFYGNPLAAYPGFDGNGQFVGKGYHYRRSKWFGCACCPPNLARMIAQFPGYLYSTRGNELAVHLYAGSEGQVRVAGQTVRLEQKTGYPWEGQVSLAIQPERRAVWTLALRIPGWCRGARLLVNGRAVGLAPLIRKGYARLTREWCKGDRVTLCMPMPVERIEAHPAVRQNCGRVALQRGPVVYCLEETDNGGRLNDLCLPADLKFAVRPGRAGILAGVPLIRAKAWRRDPGDWRDKLYRAQASRLRSCAVTAIPYFLWANRAPGEMLVWIRSPAPAGRRLSKFRG